MPISFFNTLTRKQEEFTPLDENMVHMYTCGPTVYDFPTIGNWRTYVLADIVHRTLLYNNYRVKYVMNVTDVGHLSGDNEGDASSGEDRMEKASRREGKDAWEVAKFYTDDFVHGISKINIIEPEVLSKATEHITEQIELIQKIEEKGFAYKTSDGVYFDTVQYEKAGNTYGQLSTLDEIREGARIEANPERKNPRDFALWKFSPKDKKRDMEWESPWGLGFPGWHIECSAMSMKYLGEQFDIHVGGEDLRMTHHPNEIAQSESVTDCKPFVKYWMHCAFLLVDNGRMGKSLGNAYSIQDIEEKGYSPLALRYFYFSGHYKKQINFSWDALEAAQSALNRLKERVQRLPDGGSVDDSYRSQFLDAINDDLNIPQALALAWDLLKDEAVSEDDKKATLLDFDRVFGLQLDEAPTHVDVPDTVQKLIDEREAARKEKDWERSDTLREEIRKLGFDVKDTDEGPVISPLL